MDEWIEVRGSVRPLEIDTTSSAYYVYERKDIVKNEDDDTGEVYYTYLERKTDKTEWFVRATAENKANIDALMSGLTDLYELQLEAMVV